MASKKTGGSGLGEEAYNGAAIYGRVTAIMSTIFGTIFGVIFIAVGVFLLVTKEFPEDTTTTKENNSHRQINPKVAGFMCIGFGLLMLAAVWIWFYFTMKYKEVAAVNGVGNGIGLIANQL